MIIYRPVKGERNKDRRLTQKWGERPEYYKKIGRPYHLGLDYAGAKVGSKVNIYASHPGVARALIDLKGFGNYVVIDSDGYSTYYAHLDKVYVKSGDSILLNQEIGLMGTTGNSSGVHLHFGLRMNDRSQGFKGRIDPTPYITNRPTEEVDQDIQALIDDGIRNGNYEPMDNKRLIKIIGKLYNKLK